MRSGDSYQGTRRPLPVGAAPVAAPKADGQLGPRGMARSPGAGPGLLRVGDDLAPLALAQGRLGAGIRLALCRTSRPGAVVRLVSLADGSGGRGDTLLPGSRYTGHLLSA